MQYSKSDDAVRRNLTCTENENGVLAFQTARHQKVRHKRFEVPAIPRSVVAAPLKEIVAPVSVKKLFLTAVEPALVLSSIALRLRISTTFATSCTRTPQFTSLFRPTTRNALSVKC